MIYTQNPIIRFESLLKLLRISESQLSAILSNKAKYYTLNAVTKNDKRRETYIIKDPLRKILDTVKDVIFANVQYPAYLHGSLPGKSPKTNANAHKGAVSGVLMDIESFFPSITRLHIYYMFRYCFRFSKEVSRILANVITYEEKLPLGSPVSSYVANLVLREEDELFQSLADKNYRYTRYVDDITVSSRGKLTKAELFGIKRKIEFFIKRNKFHTKRKKTQLCDAGAAIVITGLKPGPNGARICNKYVKDVLDDIKDMSTRIPYDAEIRSVQGKIRHVQRYSKSKGDYLAKKLNNILTK